VTLAVPRLRENRGKPLEYLTPADILAQTVALTG
tara:strand:+ start:694 stop:795 length:102 start_codon:yes stop_codon:yes gene_type:complete